MAGPAARRVSVSVGGALGPGTPPDLIRSADAALLRAKRLGRDRAALTGADELGRAASGVQVVAHLDHDGQWHGAEVFGAATMALGPRLDLVADTVAGWDAQGLLPAGFVVGVRLRAIDVGRRLTSHLTGLFERQAVDPSRLCIELAEDRLAHLDLDTLTMVRRLGVGIGVRDFGLGVASYERLQSLGVARLRTHDRIVSWGSERPHRDAMNLLVRVAGALGAELVVSGVERPAQLDDLRRLGVQRVTGSLVGAPVPLEHFGPALASRRPW